MCVVDVKERTNVAGGGINTAQRGHDCGDSGHILLSRQWPRTWPNTNAGDRSCMIIGTFELKHGVPVSVSNLYSDERLGMRNCQQSSKSSGNVAAHIRWAEIAVHSLCWAQLSPASYLYAWSTTSALRVLDKSIAVLPFENRK